MDGYVIVVIGITTPKSLTMVINYLLRGMILQVLTNEKQTWNFIFTRDMDEKTIEIRH